MNASSYNPAVSIIMATYNRAHFIGESVNSISAQSFENWECIVIDDGCTDNTLEIIQPILQEDSRFCYFKRPEDYKKGLPGCRNYGLDLARGDSVVFFDDDDIVHPDLLRTCLETLKKSPSDFCRYEKKPFFGEWNPEMIKRTNTGCETTIFYPEEISKMITGEIPFASCCVIWDKKCFKDIRFNEELQYAEEWECYSRILLKGFTGVSIDKVLYFNRKHPRSNTGEFWNNDSVRMASKIKAIKLVIGNLKRKEVFSNDLYKYFIRWGFQFKKLSVIRFTLKQSNADFFDSIKYILGYFFYPVLKPLLKLKGELVK